MTSDFARSFDETAITRSKEFPKYYKEVADRNGCIFFNAAQYIKPSKIDSLHLDPDAHEIFAKELSLLIKKS